MKRFKRIYIETTNICNLSCSFCPLTSRPLEMMDTDRFTKILSEVRPYTDFIYLHLMGEPLLNPNLSDFLSTAKHHDVKVQITTNGTLLMAHRDLLLGAQALRQINISLSSFEANQMTQPLETYLQEVIQFMVEAQNQGKVILSLRLWNLDGQDIQGDNQLNDEILHRLEEGLGLDYCIREALGDKAGYKIKDRLYLNQAEKFSWPDPLKASGGENIFCHGLRDHIGILVDGTVVPCCLDSDGNIPLGNILETPLDIILSSPRAQNIFDGFSNRKAVEPLCQKCGYAQRF